MLMRRAFTVVELLVVIAIISVLMALTIPAVQFAREASRKTTCLSHCKQLAMAAAAHNSLFEYYPNAGGRDGAVRSISGSGVPQPAAQQDWGVFYQILPYIEQKATYDNTNDTVVAGLKLKVYSCPSRRPPKTSSGSTANGLAATALRGSVDYAGNGGSIAADRMGNSCTFAPTDPAYSLSFSYQNGAIIPRPKIQAGQVTERVTGQAIGDGLSNVLMFGERNFNRKPSGSQADEDNGYINGWSWDTIRWGVNKPETDRVTNTQALLMKFGGPHSGVVMIAMCDGSTKALNYSAVDDLTFRQLCNRGDKLFPQLP